MKYSGLILFVLTLALMTTDCVQEIRAYKVILYSDDPGVLTLQCGLPVSY